MFKKIEKIVKLKIVLLALFFAFANNNLNKYVTKPAEEKTIWIATITSGLFTGLLQIFGIYNNNQKSKIIEVKQDLTKETTRIIEEILVKNKDISNAIEALSHEMREHRAISKKNKEDAEPEKQ